MNSITKLFNQSFADGQDFYKSVTIRYLEADNKTRSATKAHWQKCHTKNMADNREDMIIFSGKMLVAISIAEAIIEEQK